MSSIRHKKLACLGFVLSLAACQEQEALSSDLSGAPELASVELSLTGAPESEGVSSAEDGVEAAELASDELEALEVPEASDAVDLGQARAQIRALNQALRGFLLPVVAMVRDVEPSYERGALRMWGPVTRGLTEYRFFLRNAAKKQWGWRLEARVAGEDGAFERVAAGTIVVGAAARRGVGMMGFDLDALGALDPTVRGEGQLLLGFQHGPAGTTVGYALRDFTLDPEQKAAFDARLRMVHLENGTNRLRLAYRGDVEGTATEAEELVLGRFRHRRDLGGRSDLLVLGGDVPTDRVWIISQCWNAELESQFRRISDCPSAAPLSADCSEVELEGDAAACPRPFAEPELVPSDPDAEEVDPEDPNPEVELPEAVPEVTGADD